MKQNWNFQRGGRGGGEGVKPKKSSWEGMDIFWKNTIS